MPPPLRNPFTSSLRAHASAALLGVAIAASLVDDAGGQEMLLRGSIRDSVASDPQATSSIGLPASDYQPASPGALDGLRLKTGATEEDLGPSAQPTPGAANDLSLQVPSTNAEPAVPESAQPEDARDVQPAAAPRDEGGTAQDQAPTGTVRAQPAGPVEKIAVPIGGGRAQAIEDIDPPFRDDDPFAPVGIRAGTFILRPSVEQGIASSSNANYSVDGKSAVLSETILRLNAVSDWSEKAATLDAYGIFRKSISGYDVEDLRAGGLATLDVDVSQDLRTTTTLGYERAPETAASPVIIPDTVEEPIRQTLIGSFEVERAAGKARLGITGRVERDVYGEAELDGGGTLSQADRDDTLVTALLRTGYEVSPALVPFVELEVGHRFYDEEEDSSGYQRESNRLGFRAGTEVDFSEKLTGEISAGWLREKFVDDRLAPIDGPTLNALISWSPERGTKVDLTAATIVEAATTPGESGSMLHTAGIALERQVRSNVTTTAAADIGYREYVGEDGHDLLFNAEVGATYWLNRYAGITARLLYESQSSDLEGRDYEAKTAFVGVKVQR